MIEATWPVGIKKTKQREAVLRLLEAAASPLSAFQIFKQLEKGETAVSLSTVYRILELLTEKNVLIKTKVHNSDLSFYELNRPMHRHYAVCVDCHKIVVINNCPMSEFKPKLSDDEFHVLGHKVEMFGYCRDCDKRKNK